MIKCNKHTVILFKSFFTQTNRPIYRVGQNKLDCFFRVDNFVMVSGSEACYMSKVSKFCPEKN